MGLFDGLMSSIQSGAQWLGEKSKDAANYLGEKVRSALPTIGDIASGINKYAPIVGEALDSFGVPIAGGVLRGLGKGAGYVADYVKSGNANNNLEAVRKGLNTVSSVANNVKNKMGVGLGSI